jgi:hypothetical protein
VTGGPEPIRLRDPDRLRALGRAWAGWVALCPFSAGSDREYSVPGWLTLERILKAHGHQTVLVHSDAERTEPFVSPKLTGREPEEVVGCLLNAACVIGIDSGLSHLAAATGTPTVVLTAQTRGEQVFGWYSSATWLTGPLACTGCYWRGAWTKEACRPQCPSIQGIHPERIVTAVGAVRGRRPTVSRSVAEHLSALRAQCATEPIYPGGTGHGIVTAGEGRYWPMLVAMLRTLRDVGCTLPVEVWYRGAAGAVRPEDVLDLGATLIDADLCGRHYGDQRVPTGDPDRGGWENKLYALTRTRFETAIWIDADAIPLADPEPLAALADAHGLAAWTDRSHDATRHLNWTEVWPAGPGPVPGISGGQFALNRRLVWKELFLTNWICQRSDFYFPRMLGDQDALRVALTATGRSFLDLGDFTRLPAARHLYRFDLDGRPLFEHRSGPKLFPTGGPMDACHVAHFAAALAPRDDGVELETRAGDPRIGADRLRVIRDRVIATSHLPGALAALGVFRGGAARLIGAYAPGHTVHLFDTLARPREAAVRVVAVHHVGAVSGGAPSEGARYRFVHLSTDTHQSTAAALDYFATRVVPGGVIVIDDFGRPHGPGVEQACREAGFRPVRTADSQMTIRF